jgi:histidinol dehydrogenase
MKISKYPQPATYIRLLKRPTVNKSSLKSLVSRVLLDVKRNGDEALKRFGKQYDQVSLDSFAVSQAEFSNAGKQLSPSLKRAIGVAKGTIEKFHAAQLAPEKKIQTASGVTCWRKSLPIEKVGLYIPGGTAALFSTVLMLGIPARLAGCKEIVLCSPPSAQGLIHPAVLYTANLLGIKQVFKIGGIQAIGAMAYGTESVPQVYKIFGPGNQYVTAAKEYVSQAGVAIDMPAGPSELAVLADDSAVPEFVAADLLSQAEHGADSQVILVSTSLTLIQHVLIEIEKQSAVLPRLTYVIASLKNSKAILVANTQEGMDVINAYAPEHLIIACKNPKEVAKQVINAGSVFLGNYSCESAGDYASGTNHALPTNGYARTYSGVSTDSFVKKVTFQSLSKAGLATLGKAIECMAEAEGLQAHKNAVSIRLRKK